MSDENHVTYFAKTNFRNGMQKFGIKKDDRRRHMYVIGKTGMGKTTLLENMVLSDIYAGHGCCYIDPHGDTAEKIIDYIPEWRLKDVVYFNPSDMEFPIGFNILESVDPNMKHLVASGMMGVFKKIWENVWSARMEYILNNTILALLDNPGTTLLDINRMLSDKKYRDDLIDNVQDPIVKQFWIKEFGSYQEKFASEAVAPIQNKVGQFLSASIIRNIVAQPISTIRPREIMDNEQIFIVNLSKGRIGEDASRLLGGMLITKIQMAAMERVDIPEADRKDFYLYVDEFQNFAVESFASILSEARKYRLVLVMAHQYIAQLTEEVRDAVFGNVGSIVTFRVGSPDAVFMEAEFFPRFVPEDIINLPKYHIYLKLMIDGVTSQPFSAVTLPPIAQTTHSTEKVIQYARENYSGVRADIERQVKEWSGFGDDVDLGEKRKEMSDKKKQQKKERYGHDYDCTRCGKTFKLPVELDRTRPIYCEDCMPIIQKEKEESRKRGGSRGGGSRRDEGSRGSSAGSRASRDSGGDKGRSSSSAGQSGDGGGQEKKRPERSSEKREPQREKRVETKPPKVSDGELMTKEVSEAPISLSALKGADSSKEPVEIKVQHVPKPKAEPKPKPKPERAERIVEPKQREPEASATNVTHSPQNDQPKSTDSESDDSDQEPKKRKRRRRNRRPKASDQPVKSAQPTNQESSATPLAPGKTVTFE